MTAIPEINESTNSSSLTKSISFDLAKLIDEVIADNCKKYEKFFNTSETGMKITFSVKDRLFASGEKEHIATVLSFILGNSVETVNGSGKISIKLEKFGSYALLSIYSKSYMKKTNPQPSIDLFCYSNTVSDNILDKAYSSISFHGVTIKNVNTSDGAKILIITIPAFSKTERIKATRIRNHLKDTQILVAARDSLLKDSIIDALETKKAIVSRCVSSKEFNIMLSFKLFTAVIADESFLNRNEGKNIVSAIKNTILLAITDNPEHYADTAKLCLTPPVNIDFLISKLNKLFADGIFKK